MDVDVPTPPPAPTPVDPGQSSLDYINAMADPALQARLLAAEQQFRPEYARLNLSDLQTYLQGTPDQTGALGLFGDASRFAAQTQADANRLQREADIRDVRELGSQAGDAFRAANPQLQAAMERAQGMGSSGDYFSGLRQQIANQPQFQGINYSPAQAQGYTAAQLGSAPNVSLQGYDAAQVGNMPNVSLQGYAAQNAAPVGDISYQQTGQGLLGQNLYNQAVATPNLGEVGTLLQGRAATLAQSNGRLNPDEIRSAQQAVREAYAARGTEMGSGAVSAEALSRLAGERNRMVEDLGLAAALNAQNLGEIGQNRGFQQSVQGADIARQQQNASGLLQAASQNQGMAGQMSLANQAAQNQAGAYGANAANQAALANQQAAIQAAMANQAALNQAGAYGAGAANQGALANQQAALQSAFANQGALNQASQYGAGAANTMAALNAQLGLSTQEANRAFQANQYQQGIQNMGLLGQLDQSRLAQDRAYALQLAQMQAATASDPFMSILGRQSGALQYGAGQQGFAGGLTQSMQGPQLFNPDAGINLALQNSANTSSYNSNIYGANAALAGQKAGSTGSMIGAGIGAVAMIA